MDKFMKEIDGAKTLLIGKSPEDNFGFIDWFDGTTRKIEYLSINQYENDNRFYLFFLDKNFETLNDYLEDSIEKAQELAHNRFPEKEIVWENMKEFEKPYLFVDFNEGIIPFELYLLSKSDIKLDIDGNFVNIFAGMEIFAWDGDRDDNGEECILVADGVTELNTIKEGAWSFEKVKWCCRVNEKSFRHEKKDSSKFDEASKRQRENK